MIPFDIPDRAHPPKGWLARHESAKAKHAKNKDPLVMAVTKVRALLASQGEAEKEVRRAWDAENAPVLTPLPSRMHPQVVARVLAVLSDAGFVDDFDWLAPLVAPDAGSLEQRIAEAVAAEQAAFEEAKAELAELEARYKAFEAMVAAGPMGLGVLDHEDDAPAPVRAAPEPVEDEPCLPDEPVKRGRGRPPRVMVDEDEPCLPGD